MKQNHIRNVVITGVGLVTPLGSSPQDLQSRIQGNEVATTPPSRFSARTFDCPLSAEIKDFDPQAYVSEPKLARLMNRDAQLAVAAARLALRDAGISVGSTYKPEEIALFVSTGLAGLPVQDVTPLIRVSSDAHGKFNLALFGEAGLKAVSPILSFKILSNMPLCFVSINEGIQGTNAVYAPWEGDGAQSIEAGIRAVRHGGARCALVGGCDTKTHELAYATLQQLGLFSSWAHEGIGLVPAEASAFLVLELEAHANSRQARVYGRLSNYCLRPRCTRERVDPRMVVLRSLGVGRIDTVVGSADGTPGLEAEEETLLKETGIVAASKLYPKKQLGNSFAAAAHLQVAIAAIQARAGSPVVLSNCFGHGDTQAAFAIEQV